MPLREKPKAEAISQGIESDIYTGKYNFTEGNFVKCNLFLDDMTQKYWGVKVPRIKELPFGTRYVPEETDWPENPASAAKLQDYYRERAKLLNSGVIEVSPTIGKNLANSGELVMALGVTHATVMAPTKDKNVNWPLIYRSDLSNRMGDDRIKVGIKKGTRSIVFFHIDPDKYNKFNDYLLESGYSAKDVSEYYNRDESGIAIDDNPKYWELHKTLDKGQQ